MAQALTVTVDGNPFLDGSEAAKVVLDWVSAAGGTVSLGIASTFAAAVAAKGGLGGPLPSKIRGKILAIETAPGLNGDLATALPTANYDITMPIAWTSWKALGPTGRERLRRRSTQTIRFRWTRS